nr:chromaffin granule peptide [Ovis aries]
NLDPKLDL